MKFKMVLKCLCKCEFFILKFIFNGIKLIQLIVERNNLILTLIVTFFHAFFLALFNEFPICPNLYKKVEKD